MSYSAVKVTCPCCGSIRDASKAMPAPTELRLRLHECAGDEGITWTDFDDGVELDRHDDAELVEGLRAWIYAMRAAADGVESRLEELLFAAGWRDEE